MPTALPFRSCLSYLFYVTRKFSVGGRVLTDISLGRFVPGSSIIHRLDPRTKTIAALIASVIVLQGNSPWATLVHIVMGCVCVAVSGIPLRFVMRSVKPFIWLVAIIIAVHALTAGLTGAQTGAVLAVRLIVVVLVASLLTWTTAPLSVVAGLRSLGSPLEQLHVPVDAGATAIGLAMRFAPIALTEATTILNAQAARGADFRGIKRKLQLVVPLLGALFERAFSRADTLAEAMESRGFSPNARRTYYRELGFHISDAAAAAVVVLWATAGVLIDRGVV